MRLVRAVLAFSSSIRFLVLHKQACSSLQLPRLLKTRGRHLAPSREQQPPEDPFISGLSHLQKFKLDSKMETAPLAISPTMAGSVFSLGGYLRQKRPPDSQITWFPISEDMENPPQDNHFTDQKTEARRKEAQFRVTRPVN